MPLSKAKKDKREKIFSEVLDAFAEKYSWLGAQAAREMLMSVASWNIERHSDPHMRYRTHVMLSWDRGWLKSTIMRKMADILGDEMCSVIGKVTDAAMRGSTQSGKFMPPKPLKTPIVISTEFGQTDFDDELLNIFLNMLEEGHTNVSLNKIGSLPDSQKRDIEDRYGGQIEFKEENEFDVQCDFVFWGATYDRAYMQDDALRSRFSVVTPVKQLTSDITRQVDKAPPLKSMIEQDTVKALRREVQSEKEVRTEFIPPDHLYEEYTLNLRESRDIQAYMACRNWWGLDVNPEIMEDYIKQLKKSRKKAYQSPQEQVYELIFDNPKTYEEIQEHTSVDKMEIHKILQSLDAKQVPSGENKNAWVVYSGDKSLGSDSSPPGEEAEASGVDSLSDFELE